MEIFVGLVVAGLIACIVIAVELDAALKKSTKSQPAHYTNHPHLSTTYFERAAVFVAINLFVVIVVLSKTYVPQPNAMQLFMSRCGSALFCLGLWWTWRRNRV